MHLRCVRCDRRHHFDPLLWRCDCGGPLEIEGLSPFDPASLDGSTATIWRYRAALPVPPEVAPVTLGEGQTPLIPDRWDGRPLYFKAEHLNPTGSFKDRGASLLTTVLKEAGVERVVEDSSGNAGAALAAYAGRAGLRATVYVPAHASPVKRRQIAAYGAEVVPVPGPRSAATEAALAAVAAGAAYASHVYAPVYVQGMKTLAFELWEQLGRRAPSDLLLPAGHGTLLLGVYKGFAELRSQGFIGRLPRLYGVQATACAPLVRAWEQGRPVAAVAEGETVAEGVRISDPPWGDRVLAAVRESDGALLALDDRATLAAQETLARRGLYIEPTSALAVAALDALRDCLGERPVVVLTGSGFKTPPPAPDDWQRQAADFAARYGLRHGPAVHALDLVSEVGEVAKELLLATDYGTRPYRPRPALAGELGDALYSLLLLAESCDVRAGDALVAALDKYRARLAARGAAGSSKE